MHAWNDALALAETLEPGEAAKAGQLIMLKTYHGIEAWGDCPLSGIVLLDRDPSPVVMRKDIEKFLQEMQQQGRPRQDFADDIAKQWLAWLRESDTDLSSALALAREGM